MPESIKIATYFPAHPSAKDASKTVPAKFKDGNDREFTIDKGLVDFVAAHQGQTIEAVWEETQNGKWTNRKLTGAVIPTTPAVAEKPAGTGWKRDPAESSLILRQVALKAAVEHVRDHGLDSGVEHGAQVVLGVAEIFNDWLHERPTPEQRAAKEALATGGSYAEALNNQKPHVAATLKPGQSLADAARQAVIDHDNEEIPPPWVGVTGGPLPEPRVGIGPSRTRR